MEHARAACRHSRELTADGSGLRVGRPRQLVAARRSGDSAERRVGKLALGLVMAFGSGVLISAVAYELALEAFQVADGARGAAAGLFAGSIAFFAGDTLIDRYGGRQRDPDDARTRIEARAHLHPLTWPRPCGGRAVMGGSSDGTTPAP